MGTAAQETGVDEMSDLRTAAQQALNSLRGYRREIGCEQPCDAERALEAALEQEDLYLAIEAALKERNA
jgi:predicted DNA-binding protein